ncbi:hypothetical protein CRYUN_Cryun13aG0141700 [Craigia yunnanensis]
MSSSTCSSWHQGLCKIGGEVIPFCQVHPIKVQLTKCPTPFIFRLAPHHHQQPHQSNVNPCLSPFDRETKEGSGLSLNPSVPHTSATSIYWTLTISFACLAPDSYAPTVLLEQFTLKKSYVFRCRVHTPPFPSRTLTAPTHQATEVTNQQPHFPSSHPLYSLPVSGPPFFVKPSKSKCTSSLLTYASPLFPLSTTNTTTTTIVTRMSTPTSPPQSSSATATRRVPPPCWSKEETKALIEAYKEKWFALRRGNLKASDWDAVSATLSSTADPGTTKSSVQCRHKIEKLRKRYRAEKQRSLKNPGKFSSSWDLFPLLDSMNFASTSVAGSDDHIVDHKVGVFDGFYLKLKKHESIDGNYGSNLGFDHDFRGGYGSKFDFDHKFGDGFGVKWQGNSDFAAKGIKTFKSNGRVGDGYGSMVDVDHSFGQGVDSVGEFPLKTLGDRSFVNLGFKPKNYDSPNPDYDYENDLEEYSIDEGMGFRKKVSGAWDSVPKGFHQKKRGRVDRSCDPGFDCRGLNGFASCSRPGLGRKNGNAGVKKGVDPVEEMVSSIKLLAEGFVRMEKMKIEMVKEIEKTRMEMDMKHNEMILESQQKIMDAFAKALLDKKKRKKKLSMLPPNVNGNGVEEWQGDDMIETKKVDIVSSNVQIV